MATSESEPARAVAHTAPPAMDPVDAPPPRARRRGRRWLALSLALDFFLMGAMVLLDVRDLVFKTLWLGPDDSYSFTAVGTQLLQRDTSLAAVAAPPLNRSTLHVGDALPRASGWTAFLSVCDDVHPVVQGEAFFLLAMGVNCTVGPRGAHGVVIPQLIFTSSARVDSIAWAACRLLRNDRRPVVCRAALTQRFAERYNIAETPDQIVLASRTSAAYSRVVFTETSPPTVSPESDAEAELLQLLDLVAHSAPPLSRLTCVEGFAYERPGYYTAHYFGCGSATRFDAAFVGHFATDYVALHQNKAFLTVDALQLLGLSYLIRQNSWSLFRVLEPAATALIVEHTTLINFSSSGMLYTFAVVIDATLLLVSLASALEIARLVFWPLVHELMARDGLGRVGTAEAPFAFDDYKAVLTCPLFRSGPLAVLLLVSQLLCWMLVLPNAIIWTWTEDTEGKLQAFLSTLRIWIVPLILVNVTWNVVVFVAERPAYAVAARAHVTSWEVGAIACAITFVRRGRIFAIGGTKYALDTQRVADFSSFPGFLAFGNGFAEGQDTLQTTPVELLVIVYRPLGEILAWTFVSIAVCVVMRFTYHSVRGTPTALVHYPAGGTHRVISVVPQSTAAAPQAATATTLPPQNLAEYKRLPIEMLLNLPIRARSLIRSTHYMETSVRLKRFLRPSCYVEHGIVMEHHKLRTRLGFFGTIRYSTDAESHAMPSTPDEQEKEDHVPPSRDTHTTKAAVEPFDSNDKNDRQPTTTTTAPETKPSSVVYRRRVLTPLR